MIQKHVEDLVENEREAENRIINSLLKCLDLLYSNFPESDPNTMKVSPITDLSTKSKLISTFISQAFKWAHKIASEHDANILSQIHKLLFDLRLQNELGSYYDCIALQISETLGQHEEVSLTGQFELKSVTEYTIESCITFLCQCLRRQLEDIEYFITKAKSLHSKMKISGECPRTIQTMKSLERKLCSQLIHICNAATHLANTRMPLGGCMDHVKRLLIQLYVSMTNLTKYLILRYATIPSVSCESIL